MDSRKFIFKETAIVAAGQAVCIAIMIGVFALLGHFDRSVLLGGIFGGLAAVANFFFMAVGASLAADKAENQDVKGGTYLMRMSYPVRFLALAGVLVLCGISGQWQFGEEKHSISQKERVLVLQSRWQISGKCCE